MKTKWTPNEMERLKEAWGKIPSRTLAKEFRRSKNSVMQKARKLQLDAGRFYAERELAMVKELYADHAAAEISERIFGPGHGPGIVYRIAHKLGLRKCPDCRHLYEPIRRLHTAGLPDRLIARRLGISHDKAKEIRRARLKLPTHPDLEGKRQAVRTQLKVLGLRSPAELRTRAFRLYALRNGWPPDCAPREVQILNVLAERGPRTGRQLAEAIGMRTDRIGANGRPALLTGNGPGGTYTTSLLRRGFIHYLLRFGRRRLEGFYLLSPAAVAYREGQRCHGEPSACASAKRGRRRRSA